MRKSCQPIDGGSGARVGDCPGMPAVEPFYSSAAVTVDYTLFECRRIDQNMAKVWVVLSNCLFFYY